MFVEMQVGLAILIASGSGFVGFLAVCKLVLWLAGSESHKAIRF